MKVYEPIKCPECGQEFVPTRGQQKYCGKGCYTKEQRKRNREYMKKYNANQKAGKKKEKPKQKPNQELVDVAAEARKAGMSYGQYVSQQWIRGIMV